MATATFKSVAMMRFITEDLKRRLPTWTFTSGIEATTGNPILVLSATASPATTGQVATVRVSPVASVFLNGLEQTQQFFCPHYVEMCSESGTGSNLTASSYITVANQTVIFGVLMKQTGIFLAYQTANGTVPALASTATQMVVANQVADYTTQAEYLLGAV